MAHDDPDPELAETTADLYGLDPGDFVPVRNELARRLRKDGKRDLAGRVAKLRRPTPAAWAVNQLARRQPAELETLVRLGEALRAAQNQTLAGADAAALREAGRARRDAVARLTQAALGLLEERSTGAGAHSAEIAATLEAASLDPQAAVDASSGRLTSSLEPPSGFGAFGTDLGAAPPEPDLASSVSEPQQEEPAGTTGAQAVDRVAGARRAAAAARQSATDLGEKAHDASVLAARRHREVDDAEEALARAKRGLDEARRRAEVADRRSHEAQEAAAQAEATAAAADADLREAEREVGG